VKTSSRFQPDAAGGAARRGGPEATTADPRPEILVVEDEAEFAELVARWLVDHGLRVTVVRDGTLALRRLHDRPPDLVLLDLTLPGLDGWRLIDEIRAAGSTPTIVLTARGRESDRVRGLESGADDYLTKPVSFPELLARIRGVLRRARAARPAGAAPSSVIERSGLRLDLDARTLAVDGRPVHLTPTEFRLLRRLLERPGEVVAHAELLRAVWGATYGPDDVPLLRTMVRNLRAKLDGAAPGRRFIATRYGLGYQLLDEAPDHSEPRFPGEPRVASATEDRRARRRRRTPGGG
jgi:DNA-binding response OmpR family regulator